MLVDGCLGGFGFDWLGWVLTCMICLVWYVVWFDRWFVMFCMVACIWVVGALRIVLVFLLLVYVCGFCLFACVYFGGLCFCSYLCLSFCFLGCLRV